MDQVAIALESGDFATALPYIEGLSSAELSALALPDRRTPLHYACQHGRIDVAQQFIAKYKIDRWDARHYTPLNTAVQYGQLDMVKYLLHDMFMREAPEIMLKMKPGDRLSKVISSMLRDKINHYCRVKNLLDTAYIYNNLNIVRFLVEEIGFHPTECLPMAAKQGNFPLVRYLVEIEGWNVMSKIDAKREFPREPEYSYKRGVIVSLFVVAATPHLDILKYMIEKYDIDPDFKTYRVYGSVWRGGVSLAGGTSLLHEACKGYLPVVKYLIDYGCNPSLKDDRSVTPLHHSCKRGHLDMVRYLINIGCHPAGDYEGTTPLFLACENGHLDIVKYLVMEAKCDPNFISRDSETYLHAATASGSLNIMKFLTDYKCKIQQDFLDKSPLHLAASASIFKFLIEVKNCDPEIKDRYKMTPLHYASQKGHIEIVQQLVDTYHCNPLSKDENDFTPLEYASTNGEVNLVKYLTTAVPCSPEWWVHCKCSLYLAAQEGHLELVKYFIEELKCDPSCRVKWNRIPLHAACIDGCIKVVKYLVETHKCDPAIVDEDGNTPMHLACVKDQVDVVKYFITKLHCFSLTKIENLHGITVFHKPRLYSHDRKVSLFLERVFSKIPVRIFITGNSGAGKSTLMKALTCQYHFLGRLVKVKDVPPQTTGIHTLTFYSEEYGKVKFYDFAGHEEYYASHEIILQNVMQSLIFITINLSMSMSDVRKQLLYWNNIVSNVTHAIRSKNSAANMHVIVVGSHADSVNNAVIKEAKKMASDLLSEEMDIPYRGFIACDCRYSISSSMKHLTSELNSTCKIIRANISLLERENSEQLCELLLKILKESLRHDPAEVTFVTVRKLHDRIKGYYAGNEKLNENYQLLKKPQILKDTFVNLSNSGQILLIPSQQAFEDSIIVFDEDVLLSKVHGCLKDLNKSLSNSSGILDESQVIKITSSLVSSKLCRGTLCTTPLQSQDVDAVLKYLVFAQFCTAIAPKQLINPSDDVKQTACYFFPNLVHASRPKNLSIAGHDCYSKFYTWSLKCSNAHHFFTPMYIHTLFIQIVKCEPDTDDAKYVIWKNGILLVHSSGTRAIIEVTDQTTRVYLSIQCVKGFELELIKQRSKLILLLKSLASKVCPMVELSEVLSPPHSCYPPENMTEILTKEIAHSVINHHPFVVVSDPSGATPTALQHVQLSDLVFFDSLNALGRTCLVEVFSKKDSHRPVPSISLARVCKSISSNEKLQAKLEGMRKLSYSQLYAELLKYSIFPEGNIFVSPHARISLCSQI